VKIYVHEFISSDSVTRGKKRLIVGGTISRALK